MTDPEIDEADISKPAEEADPEPAIAPETETPEDPENPDPEAEPESEEALRARAEKAEELAKNYKIRAEKAEKAQKKPDPAPAPAEQTDLSSKDTMALISAGVHVDDVDEVVEYARFKKVSIAKALESTVIKTALAEKAEHRATAAATNVGRNRSGQAKPSGESLLNRARKTGEIPESKEEMDKLIDERLKPE